MSLSLPKEPATKAEDKDEIRTRIKTEEEYDTLQLRIRGMLDVTTSLSAFQIKQLATNISFLLRHYYTVSNETDGVEFVVANIENTDPTKKYQATIIFRDNYDDQRVAKVLIRGKPVEVEEEAVRALKTAVDVAVGKLLKSEEAAVDTLK